MKNILAWVVVILLLCPTKSISQTFDINQPGLTIQQINSAIQANLTTADTKYNSYLLNKYFEYSYFIFTFIM